jgi:hypothetical protein
MRIVVGEIGRRLSKLMKEEPRKVEEYIINTRPHANSAICQESAM